MARGTSLVEAFPAIDGAAPGIQAIVDRSNAALRARTATLTGVAAVDRDFVHALFGSFPYVLALVLLLTMILLTRAFRSLVLALKAALLNLVSLAAPSASSSSSSSRATAPGSGTSRRPSRSWRGSP